MKSHTFIENSVLPRCEIRWIYLVLKILLPNLPCCHYVFMDEEYWHHLSLFIHARVSQTTRRKMSGGGERFSCDVSGRRKGRFGNLTNNTSWGYNFFSVVMCMHFGTSKTGSYWISKRVKMLKLSAELIKRQPVCKIFHLTSKCLSGWYWF